jgi:hypothetical protein
MLAAYHLERSQYARIRLEDKDSTELVGSLTKLGMFLTRSYVHPKEYGDYYPTNHREHRITLSLSE